MINFKKLELSDRDWINEQLKKSDFKSCDYSFANNFIWQKPYKIEFADINGFYCLKNAYSYTYPAGEGDIKPVIEALMEDAEKKGEKFILRGIMEENVELIESLFPGKFEFSHDRGESDYLYLSEKLISLSGRKLHSKRNHIARFKDRFDWVYEDIDESNIADCIKMSREWCEKYNTEGEKSLGEEMCAVNCAFKNFFELGLKGGLIRADGKVVAFTIGEPLSSDTFVVHIEKAFADIQGAYPIINQQFAEHNCAEFMYVNREEDMGDEGLRKAKLSYYPAIILDKYTAVIKED